MSINNAKAALADPPAQLKTLLTDNRVSQEAREGLKAAGLDVEKLKSKDMAQVAASESRLQVVDENQNFSYVGLSIYRNLCKSLTCVPSGVNRKALSKYLSKWELLDKGFAYDVVAVFGSQSTGKSELDWSSRSGTA